jgi:hypothetical protein
MEDGPDLLEILEAQSSYHVTALLDERTTDTTEPMARDWLSRWGPSGIQPRPLACSCKTGTCRICN